MKKKCTEEEVQAYHKMHAFTPKVKSMLDDIYAQNVAHGRFLGDVWSERAELIRINRKEVGMPPLPEEDYERLLRYGPNG